MPVHGWLRSLAAGYRLWFVVILSLLSADGFAAELPYGRLTPFDPLTLLPSASVRNMIFDDQGQAWFTVYSSGVGYYTGDALTLFTTEDGLSSVTVNGIGIDAEGYVWVASEKGVSVSTAPTSALMPASPSRLPRATRRHFGPRGPLRP